MAIFAAGSNWDGNEMKEVFFNSERFIVGWDYKEAKDLYDAFSALKAGDIIYLKASKPGSRSIRVKGIGIVTKSLIHSIKENESISTGVSDQNRYFIHMKWIVKDEFPINIPKDEGKTTFIRAGTFHEEYLPYVQNEIIANLIKYFNN